MEAQLGRLPHWDAQIMKMQLAELNVARLVAPTDDPRVREFMDNLDLINSLGRRMPGFVWMMDGLAPPGEENPDIEIAGDPLLVPNLTVWEDARSLERFVWGTVHRKFYDRRAEWFGALDEVHLVMWWVPKGHRPTLAEGLERLDMRRRLGDSEDAFGWDWLKGTA